MGIPIPCPCCISLVWDGLEPVRTFLSSTKGDASEIHAACLAGELRCQMELAASILDNGGHVHCFYNSTGGVGWSTLESVMQLSVMNQVVASGRRRGFAGVPREWLDDMFGMLIYQVRNVDDWNGWFLGLWREWDKGTFHNRYLSFFWKVISDRRDAELMRAFRLELEDELVESNGYRRREAAATIDSAFHYFGELYPPAGSMPARPPSR